MVADEQCDHSLWSIALEIMGYATISRETTPERLISLFLSLHLVKLIMLPFNQNVPIMICIYITLSYLLAITFV